MPSLDTFIVTPQALTLVLLCDQLRPKLEDQAEDAVDDVHDRSRFLCQQTPGEAGERGDEVESKLSRINCSHLLTCSLEVEPDITEAPHHVFELQQEGEQTVVLVHAAVRDDDVQRPVHLGDDTREERDTKARRKKVCEGVSAIECERKHRKEKQELGRTGKGRVTDEAMGGVKAETLIKEVRGL
ncbi:hypothetical protein INR49_024975 [Caranx melampygus]|nr:hypothetical protein INR49_024975 [Caranx melampygus]